MESSSSSAAAASSSSSSAAAAAAAEGTTTTILRRPVTRRCVRPPLRSPLPIYGRTDCPNSFIHTKGKSPPGYDTAREDLRSASQQFLLQIEKRMMDYKDESRRLDPCSRLNKYSECGDSFQFEVNGTKQVEWLHQRANSMTTAYPAGQRRVCDANYPFLEADRRKIAEQGAATSSELLLGQGL